MLDRGKLFIMLGLWQTIVGFQRSVDRRKDGNPTSRSSRPEVFFKKGVLRDLTKFAGKHLCQSPFFNKVAG